MSTVKTYSVDSGDATNLTLKTNGTTALTVDGTTQAVTISGSQTVGSNLTFTGTGNRITGDFSNATLANRVWFRDATTNNSSSLGVIPNGTSLISSVIAFGGSDPDNTSRIQMRIDGASEAQLRSEKSGTGSYLPMTFYTGGSERMRLDTSGNLGLGTASPSGASGTTFAINGGAGQTRLALKNNGSGDASSDGFQIVLLSDGVNVVYQNRESGYQAWEGNGTERMRIDSIGNVGIGASSPSSKLDVVGSGATLVKSQSTGNYAAFYANGATGNAAYYFFAVNATETARIYSDAGNYIGFATGSSGTERMRIDSSGNVGIGTSSPPSGSRLAISGGALNFTETSGRDILWGTSSYVYITGNQGTGVLAMGTGSTERMRIDSSGNVGIGTSSPATTLHVRKDLAGGTTYPIYADNGAGGAGVNVAGVAFVNAGSSPKSSITAGVYGNDFMAFNVNGNTERMRIDASGNLLVGTTSGTAQTNITSTSTKNVMNLRNYDDLGRGIALLNSSGGGAGSITWTATTTAYATSSDYRLKENIAPMTGALAKVAALKPCTYKWKADGSDGQGFIAHELAEVVSDCVSGEKDAVDEDGNPKYQGIDTSFLVATLTAAIQEQQAIIEQLKADVAALKGKV